MMFKFVLVDHTTDLTPDNMRPSLVFEEFVIAWQEQIDGPFGSAFGKVVEGFRIATSPTDRASDEIAINFRDTIPEAPGALAYHLAINGVPDIEIGVDLFDALTEHGESVDVGGSHELLELLADPGGNGWKDKQDVTGTMGAEETCDPVQNTNYRACNGLLVSNFILPNYFIPGSMGPWDYGQAMKSQNDYSKGYEIQAVAPSQISQVSGIRSARMHKGKHVYLVGHELTGKAKLRKSLPTSRTFRKGIRLGQ